MNWPESTEPVLTVFPRGQCRHGGLAGGEMVVAVNLSPRRCRGRTPRLLTTAAELAAAWHKAAVEGRSRPHSVRRPLDRGQVRQEPKGERLRTHHTRIGQARPPLSPAGQGTRVPRAAERVESGRIHTRIGGPVVDQTGAYPVVPTATPIAADRVGAGSNPRRE